MNISRIPILLTSSVVAHDNGVRLQDQQERTRLALESVKAWRTFAPQNPLVLCDGSGFDFSPLVTPWLNQAPIECLSFQNNVNLIQLHGRGYGEGEIVRHALHHSIFIQQTGCFAKCTSKLWVENFFECMKYWNGKLLLKGVFDHVFSISKAARFAYIDTRFYAASSEAYTKYFLHAHENIHAHQGHGLEECFRDKFIHHELNRCLMYLPPVICGVGGGTGAYYKNTKTRRLKENLRYRLIKRLPNFTTWFAE